MRLGRRVAGCAERLAYRPVAVEIDLPVVRCVAVGAHGQHWSALVEREDLDIGRRGGDDVRDLGQRLSQTPHRVGRIDAVVELGRELHAAVRIVAEILDRPAHDLRVADHRLHVVGRVDRRVEQSDQPHSTFDIAGDDVVADLEGPQHEDERAPGEIRQEPAPGRPHGDAEARDQRGERRRLDPEVAEDRDDQDDVQRDGEDRADVADDGRLDFLPFERVLHEVRGEPDQNAADDVGDDCADQLEPECDQHGLRGFQHCRDIHESPGGERTA